MTKRLKFIYGVAGTLALLCAGAAALIYYLLVKSLPETEGELSMPGVSAEVEIIRDEMGVPHIMALNEYDAYYSMGFVHAQDRLWQMDATRRYGQGRLSELFGTVTLPFDKMMHTLDIAGLADSLYAHCSPQTRNILEAYSRGVNDCIGHMKNRYPIEFDALNYTPEPWKPQHSLLIARLMAWEMALSWWSDLTFAEIIARMGAAKGIEIIPDGKKYLDAQQLYRDSALFADAKVFRETYQNLPLLLKQAGITAGSNSWAVTGAKAVRGKPVFANDPHLRQSQPVRWYIVHVVSPGMNISGATIPGAPGVIIGSNGSIAWGITNAMIDDIDVSYERLRLRDSTYQSEDGFRKLAMRTDSIFVRDTAGVEVKIYRAGKRPVVTLAPGVLEPLSREETAPAISIRWTGYEYSDEILALFHLNRARNWGEFRNAVSHFGAPCQRFMYADTSGVIGVQDAGFVPLRSARNAILPSAGWNPGNAWDGIADFSSLPFVVAPETQYLAAANTHPVVRPGFFLSNIYEDSSRYTRINQLLREQPSFTSNDFRLMQMDYTSPYAAAIRDEYLQALSSDPGRRLETTWAMNVLAGWDLRMSPSSVAAALFNAAYQELLKETFEDELGEALYTRYVLLSNVPTRVIASMLKDTSATWFDNRNTAVVETKTDILRKSFTQGMRTLQTRLGSSMNEWKWGAIHTVEFGHPFGAVKPFDKVFNAGPYSVGGNNSTINNSEYSFALPFNVSVTASMRFIADMASPDTCSIVLTTGQSGQPISDHYSDQAGLWQNGAYHTLLRNPETIRNKNWRTLRLVPKR